MSQPPPGPGRPGAGRLDAWADRYDEEAGPLVRLYAMTSGRARTGNGAERMDLMAIVRPTYTAPLISLPPEQRHLLALCAPGALPVADLASDSGLPLGVVRVLLGDLVLQSLVTVTPPGVTRAAPHPTAEAPVESARPDAHLLREVIHGLRAL